MAQEQKYEPEELEAKCEEYFRRCRRTQAVREQVPLLEEQGDGCWRIVTDEKGRPVMIEREVTADSGEVMSSEDYLVPPSITGLCLFLGISRETWRKYAKRASMKQTCEKAKMRVEVYLQGKLLERDSQRGAQFALEHNFGWRERQEISVEKETRKDLKKSMSIRDKAALLREIAEDAAGGLIG